MDRERLIVVTVILLIYCFSVFPLPTIIITVVCALGYSLFRVGTDKNIVNNRRTEKRIEALTTAHPFLAPYKDIWDNLKLSNPNCKLYLEKKGTVIRGCEKLPDGSISRKFTAMYSSVHSMQDIWDMICMTFTYNTTYDGLKEACRIYRLVIAEENVKEKEVVKLEEKQEIQKVDVNNCTEDELTNLPGVSVIMAKKAVKRREEIGGFKSIGEFFGYLKLKMNIRENLQDKIIVNEMKGVKRIDRFDERNIDL